MMDSESSTQRCRDKAQAGSKERTGASEPQHFKGHWPPPSMQLIAPMQPGQLITRPDGASIILSTS